MSEEHGSPAAPEGCPGFSFDTVAATYDRARPRYPEELIDLACETVGLRAGCFVLEIGCASGQLTRSLLARGLHVTAVEPGMQLLALAQHNLQGLGDVEFINTTFEQAPLPTEHYQAVFAASSFHWLDPKISWAKVARVLAPAGSLALLQYCGLNEKRSRPDQEALLTALAKIAPEVVAGWPSYRDLAATVAGARARRANISEAWSWLGSHRLECAEAARLFGKAEVAATPMLLEHTPAEIIGLMNSASYYQRLSEKQRLALEAAVAALYEQRGRKIRSSTVAVLLCARHA